LHPENFLNPEQELRFDEGKMRFIPGPTSVIEAPLIVGFVGKNERTGHPSQKPEAVFERIILMSTKKGDTIIDLMAGSGTTGSVAKKHRRSAILCDNNEEYIEMMEKRLRQKRIQLDEVCKEVV
jgi:site-specific DNA-methyltransferase (adenine-specific)